MNESLWCWAMAGRIEPADDGSPVMRDGWRRLGEESQGRAIKLFK